MSFEPLHTNLAILRGLPVKNLRPYVKAFLLENNCEPGETEVIVTPWTCELKDWELRASDLCELLKKT